MQYCIINIKYNHTFFIVSLNEIATPFRHKVGFRMTSGAWSKHLGSTQSTQSTQRILNEHSESNQKEREQSDFVIPSEPKILGLVS